MSKLGQQILQRAKELEDIRRDYEDGLWDDIGKYVNPRREDLRTYDHTRTKGRRRGTSAYANTAQQALNIWADGMQGLLVSESKIWFRSELSLVELNRLPEVMAWLQDYDDAMFAAFKRSNFYTAMPLYFRDGGPIGTATIFTEEDIPNGTQVHTTIHPREVFIAENRFGQVDTVFRKFEKTARQLVQEFRKENLPSNVIVNASRPGTASFKYIIWHAVWPNVDTWTPKKGNSVFRSVYVISRDAASNDAGHSAAASPSVQNNEKDVIHEGGFGRDPYAVWRFRKNSDEAYGYSPAADNIIPIFKDNQLGRTLLDRAQRESSPPANVPEYMRGNVRLGPDGMNYYEDPNAQVSYVPNPGNYTVGVDREDRLKEAIENAYYVKLFTFLLNSEREKTAFEIDRTESQIANLASPHVDQLFKEGIDPIFSNVAEIEEEAGRLPPPPPIVQAFAEKENVQINVRLKGLFAQAQTRMLKLGPINAGINAVAALVPLYPNALDRIDEDETIQAILDATDFPQRLILSDEEVAAKKEARAQAEAQQQALEQAAAIAEAIPPTKTIEPNSPLEQLAGVA
jgi:hypothetical protein